MPRTLSAEGLARFIIGYAGVYSGDVERAIHGIAASPKYSSFTASGRRKGRLPLWGMTASQASNL